MHKSVSLDPTPMQTNLVHTVTSYFLKIHFNTFLCLVAEIASSLQFFWPKFCIYIWHLPHPCSMPYPSPPWYDCCNNIWWRVQVPHSAAYPIHHFFFSSKYSPHHPVLRHPHSSILDHTEQIAKHYGSRSPKFNTSNIKDCHWTQFWVCLHHKDLGFS